MAFLSADAAGIIRPEEVADLVIKPVERASVALQVATVVSTGSATFRIPVINTDVQSAWTAEGADIALSDPDTDYIEVVPKKLAALSKVSRELAADSSPEASGLVGESIARDIAAKIDKAFFGDTITNGPDGVLSVTDRQQFTVSPTYENLNPFNQAVAQLEDVGANVTAWVANSSTALALATLKTGSDRNTDLLQPDATQPTRRQILGRPLYVVQSGTIADGVVYAFDRSRVFAVLRQNTELSVDESFYFGSDSLAVRATLRIAFGFPHAEAIAELAAGGS